MNGKNNDSGVSSPKIDQWTLALLNWNVSLELVQKFLALLYGLVTEGQDNANDHECLLIINVPKLLVFQMRTGFTEETIATYDLVWFTNGSTFYIDGMQYTRFIAL